MIDLPRFGDTITTKRAIELMNHYGLIDLMRRVKSNPDKYVEWKFDGCSFIPDELLGLFTGIDWRKITYDCCLPHDLRYAYGTTGDNSKAFYEKERADNLLYHGLIDKAGMSPWLAEVFRYAVELGGEEKFGLSFSWGFARKA